MTRRLKSATMIAAALFATPALAGNALIARGTRVAVAKSALMVTPDRTWNKLDARIGRVSETWTIDGYEFNDVSFYGGIADDQPLFRQYQKAARPLPHFSSTMPLSDVPMLLAASYGMALGARSMKIDAAEPTPFLGRRGVKFAFTFTDPYYEVRRKGEAAAAIVDGKLYMITFEAPGTFYYQRDVAAYRAIVASAVLSTGAATK